MTIMFYVQNLRITQAKKLLREGKFSITEIAFQVGFNDSNYFSSCFKKATGISPLEYRKLKKVERHPAHFSGANKPSSH